MSSISIIFQQLILTRFCAKISNCTSEKGVQLANTSIFHNDLPLLGDIAGKIPVTGRFVCKAAYKNILSFADFMQNILIEERNKIQFKWQPKPTIYIIIFNTCTVCCTEQTHTKAWNWKTKKKKLPKTHTQIDAWL